MSRHITMDIFSRQWWMCIIVSIIIIFITLYLPKYFKWAQSKSYDKTISIIILLNLIFENVYGWQTGQWDIKDNLPLHLCGISGLLAIVLLFSYNQAIAQIFFYWALAGGIHSMLTPEFDLGINGYFFYGYFISHGSLLFVCFYMILHKGFVPEKDSWIKAFLILQLVVLTVGISNSMLGSNYMYLSSPPIVDNPLIIGKWPYYIFVFEILALIHFYSFYRLYHYLNPIKRLK